MSIRRGASRSKQRNNDRGRRQIRYVSQQQRNHPNFRFEKNVIYQHNLTGGDRFDNVVITLMDVKDNRVKYRKYPYRKDITMPLNIFKDGVISGTETAIRQNVRLAEAYNDPDIIKRNDDLREMLRGRIPDSHKIDEIEDMWNHAVKIAPTREGDDIWSHVESYGNTSTSMDNDGNMIVYVPKRNVAEYIDQLRNDSRIRVIGHELEDRN